MIDTRIRLSGAVRPYYGGTRVADEITEPQPHGETTTVARSAPIGRSCGVSAPQPTASRPAPKAEARPSRLDSRDIVRKAAERAGWAVLELGNDLQIDVSTPGHRSQVVSVEFDRRDREGRPLVVLASLCGTFEERNAAPLLRYNAKLPYGAFSVERTADQEEIVVLRASLPAASVHTDDIRHIIAELAERADKVEGKLTGRDQF